MRLGPVNLMAGLALIGASLAPALVRLAITPADAEAVTGGDRPGQVLVGDLPRTFLIHAPDRPPPPGGFPLVLAFHGGGGQAPSMARLTRLDVEADQRGFIVVYPNGIDRHWNDGRASIKRKVDDIGFVAALLDQVEQTYPVDRGRIYATGMSNGAIFAERVGCDLSDRVAAIAPVAGTLASELAPSCRPARPVSVLQVGGAADPIMPFGGGGVAAFGGRGEGGTVLSAVATAEHWARMDGCGPPSADTALPPIAPPDGTSAHERRYGPCRAGTSVRLVTIEGGGHAWPGGPQYLPRLFIGASSRQFDATREVVDFFLSQPPH